MRGQPLLEATGITVSYGTVTAVDRLDLSVHAGQLVGLIGPNGAGKTSVIDALTGFTPCSGKLAVGGTDVSRLGPHRRAGIGLRRTWQSMELFDDLTVLENLQVSQGRRTRMRHAQLKDVLDLLGLNGVKDQLPPELSQGQRKLVGVGRALVAQPSVVAMDEPAAGLDSDESDRFGAKLRQLVDGGLSILLVDHDMNLVMGMCDYLYVLDFGRLIAKGKPQDVVRHPAVIAAYLGLAADQTPGKTDDESVVGETS